MSAPLTRRMARSHALLPLVADRPGRAATHTQSRRAQWRVSHRREPGTAGALLWLQGRGVYLASEWGFKSPSVAASRALVCAVPVPDYRSGATGTASLHWCPSLSHWALFYPPFLPVSAPYSSSLPSPTDRHGRRSRGEAAAGRDHAPGRQERQGRLQVWVTKLSGMALCAAGGGAGRMGANVM